MRVARPLITLLVLAAIGAGVAFVVVTLVGGGSSGYLVRAVFDNSSFVSPGEEVRVAGVDVGTIQAVQLTSQNKAALVLQINNREFEPFRTDAHCQIGLESLLGEQFVQCTATQPRARDVAPPPALPAISSGPNQGQHVLPVQNTTTPVGFDLLQDITRLPEQERLRLILTGLGAGLDANGQQLNAALTRADPALEQTDRVVAVLAQQDRILADLTDESARVLQPLAAQRGHISGFIQHVGTVASASASEGHALAQNIKDLPPFLEQLKPAASRLTGLAEQLTPSLQTLAAHAPQINEAVTRLGPFAKAATPALITLGAVAGRGARVFPAAHRVVSQLLALSKPLLPLADDLAAIAVSFDHAGGIEDVMRFIYYYTGSINGEDALGHFIRSLVTITSIGRTPNATSGQGTANFTCELRSCPTGGPEVPAGRRPATPSARSSSKHARPAPKPHVPTGNGSRQPSTPSPAQSSTFLRYLLAP